MEFTKLETKEFDCCSSPIAFVLNNGENEFFIQLEILLKCLRFASDQGKIPAIPEDWWTNVVNCCDKSIINDG